jgi:hypothetical protein
MEIVCVYITLTYYYCKLAFTRIAYKYIAIDERIIYEPDCMQIECALREKNEEGVFVHAAGGFKVRCSITLTMQC